jgi:formyl-CoA transferase
MSQQSSPQGSNDEGTRVDNNSAPPAGGPLTGVTVLELGGFIAGPLAGQILGDYGADVIKVEDPATGDPMRTWGVLRDGHSLWWPSIARNKKSVCVDLRDERGRQAIRRLTARCDIVIENFRPGQLSKWGLGFDELSAVNPRVILVHVSGFGQSGPLSERAGFGSVGEAMGGLRYTTGDPSLPPSRAGISLGDGLTALFAVMGALAALNESRSTGVGQEVDVAIYEAVAAMMESTMADFELGGVRRERTGATLPGVAPSNVYPTVDGTEILIAANGDSIFARLCEAMNRPELAHSDKYEKHVDRGRHMAELDELISEWSRTQTADELLETLEIHAVPSGRIFTAEDMVTDKHYEAREMVQRHTSFQGWQVPMPGVVPKFSRTPGSIRSTGPPLGTQTREVLCGLAGLSAEEFEVLETARVVSSASSPITTTLQSQDTSS